MTRTRSAAIAAVALVLAAAGCSDGGADARGTSRGADDASWTTSTDPLDTRGLVWAADDVVHLADGTTVDVGEAVQTYVVAGDGVYFTQASDDADHGPMTTGPLRFADRGGGVVDTGLTVYVESLGSSPDGRYLGLVDATSGPRDDVSDYPQATAVVLDLVTGERVVDSTEGMGDPGEDDLAHDYPETYLRVRFPDADSVFVEGLGGTLYSLPDGEGAPLDPIDSPVHDPSSDTNRPGTWTIDRRGALAVLRSAEGQRVRPRTGTAASYLGWWLDDRTVVGVAQEPGDPATLVTCVVPSGACTPVEGTTGRVLRFPVDRAASVGVDLTG